jgi:hypothetical protein
MRTAERGGTLFQKWCEEAGMKINRAAGDSLMEMAIGPGIAGGNNRQTLTDEDSDGMFAWCDEAGMTMGVDEMGNMFARREGRDCRSMWARHLDTQPTGGKYDGVLGVLGGLEIIRTLNDLISRRSIPSWSPTGPTRRGRATRPPCSPRACSPASTRSTGPMTGWTPRQTLRR